MTVSQSLSLEKTVYELSVPGRQATNLPDIDVPTAPLPSGFLRTNTALPELTESQIIRHYLRLSQRNYGVDSGFYPLGSCTMKHNPKLNEQLARLSGFTSIHPLQNEATVQGALELMHDLQECLKEIGGFSAISLQPAAGAQGELTALLMIRACHKDSGQSQRDRILIPDSAHGTNPASVKMAGFTAVEIPSDARGNIDINAVRAACNDRLAGIMLTNPNTLGLFEERITDIAMLVHEFGGLVYGDGANMNALTGIVKPAELGIDLMHFNLHKTFATPHGGGGPGSGPLGASPKLADYLPGPLVEKTAHDVGPFRFIIPERSIGRVTAFHGNFGMLVRAYSYIRSLGESGLRTNAADAVLNANYICSRLKGRYPIPFDRPCMHEFVCEGRPDNTHTKAIDICKRLIDFGFHPPTNYFPLIVREALMIEPTETEPKEVLDAFVEAMLQIADEAREAPEELRKAPRQGAMSRLDEVKAAREPVLTDPKAPKKCR